MPVSVPVQAGSEGAATSAIPKQRESAVQSKTFTDSNAQKSQTAILPAETLQYAGDRTKNVALQENVDSIVVQKPQTESVAEHLDSVLLHYNLFQFGISVDSTNYVSLIREKYGEDKALHTTAIGDAPMGTGYDGLKRSFSLEQVDGIFALLLFCLLCMSMIIRSGLSLFNSRNIFQNFNSKSDSHRLYKETTTSEVWSRIFLIFQAVFLSSIIVYATFVEQDNGKIVHDNSFLNISVFMLVLFVFILLKDLMYGLFGYLFDRQSEIRLWRKYNISLLNLFGIVIFLPTLFLIYSDHYHLIVLIVVLILFVLFILLIFYHIIAFFLQQNVNILFLIIYLCSVEILPYAIVYYGLKFIYESDIIS
ncbi:MAG: DUF4271 domain-containing protein [Dysgonomonas sp.]